MKEKIIKVETRDGTMEVFVTAPEEGGPHPVVILFQDSIGIREELYDMCRRIGTVGYFVAMPNLYYRTDGIDDVYIDPDKIHEPGPEKTRLWEMIKSVNNDMVVADTEALLAALAKEPDAAPQPYGQVGYCMSGQFVYANAGRLPDAFAATMSVYGSGHITKFPQSPHLTTDRITGEIEFACAEDDHWAPLEQVEQLRQILSDAGVKHRVDIYPGVIHGFAFPGRAVYDKPAAERHWERMFSLFERTLKAPRAR